MPEACFKTLFGDQEPGKESELNWLKLKAANGLAIPYVGYVLAEVQVGGITLKDMGIVISKDDPDNRNALPILGMNVIVPSWDMLFSKPQIQTQTWPVGSTVDTQQPWASTFQDCQRIQAAAPVQQVGTLRPAYRHLVMIPGHSEQVIWARAPQTLRKGQCILVEPLEGPSTVAVARSLGIVRKGRVPIKVRNLNPFPITLRRYEALATFSTENVDIQEPFEVTFEQTRPGIVEVGVYQVSPEPPGNAHHIEVMTQGKSDLSTEEQEKLNGLLRKWGDVFAAHEEDYGHTDVITHSIPTGMAPPIRERYRPIPPKMYQEVQELLNNMIRSGVVRESTSPWAVPIVLVRKKKMGN
ncbi:unnamed protein product [Oreochromis niloticus]|nr:unnamed protein product [Mustela putorius furo]